MRPTSRARIAAGVAAVIVFGGVALAIATRPSPPRAIPWPSLLNATYPVALVPRGATLKDGLYDVEAAPGSASRVVVRLADTAAFGDLDGTGGLDAAVVLVSSGGGSGTFVEIAAVTNEAGAARPAAMALLGDRVLVREVAVRDHSIVVRMRARGATDPLTLRTREITRTYAFQVFAPLRLTSETESEVSAAPADAFVYRPTRVDVPAGSVRELGGRLGPGQIASYVVHARAGQILDLSVRSEFENAVLSVFGLTDGVQLVSRRDYAVDRSVALSVEQDYAVKVVSLAGQDLPFTLRVGVRAPALASATPQPSQLPRPSRTPTPTAAPAGDRALRDASAAADTFARTRPPVWGVAVVVPSRGVVYAQDADEQVPTASVVKVLVMLTVLEQARNDGRPVSEAELSLLWPMITESDNDATSELWERVGRGQAVSSYVRSVGVSGFTPDPGTSWGVSFVSARAMATILAKLVSGAILDAPSRALALRLMESVVPEQRWGVDAGTDASAAQVALKNGWYPGDEGWRVNSVGIVRPKAGDAYAIAIVSDGRASWREGIDTIEGIAGPLNAALRGAG